MNNIEKDILNYLIYHQEASQRNIAVELKVSLGKVNQTLHNLKANKYISVKGEVTDTAIEYLTSLFPQRAVILAAGAGFRMIPLNKEVNKAFLIANGDSLIERLIKQLIEVGINDISVVVGYRKEEFDFLIDKYNVELIVNEDYGTTNSLYSLYKAKNRLRNAYILPCDIYFHENPFLHPKSYSWFMMKEKQGQPLFPKRKKVSNAWYQLNSKQEIGIAYLTFEDQKEFCKTMQNCYDNANYSNAFWEDVLHISKYSLFEPKVVDSKSFIECNECNDLLELDQSSSSLDCEAFQIIMDVFNIQKKEIKNIKCTKAGMTNNSFLFEIHDQKYIMRIPGEGTSFLIDRKQEYEVYQRIEQLNLSDRVYYFNENNGYKITAFISDAHNCDANNEKEVKAIMQYLKKFHDMKLTVGHKFDLFSKIEYYETLWEGKSSIYSDYDDTKKNVFELRRIIDKYKSPFVLTHIDAVPDNFIFHEENGKQYINLIDWEYAAMQDPHLDIAMFAIYALYDKQQIDNLIKWYFGKNECFEYKIKIYCYIASAGLLWSNWCEYKRHLGVEFGDYSLRQYRYAKDYYKIVKKELDEMENI